MVYLSQINNLFLKFHSRNWFKWREESMRRKHSAEKEKTLEATALTSNVRVQHKNGVTTIHLGSNPSKPQLDGPLKKLTSHDNRRQSQDKVTGLSGHGYVNKSFSVDKSDQICSDVFEVIELKCNNNNNSINQNLHTSQQQQVNKIVPQALILQHNDLTANEWDDFLAHINPIDLDHWRSTNITRKIISIIRAPLLFGSIITIPVVDHDRNRNNWCRLLNTIHCITIPLIITLLIQFIADENYSLFGLPLPVLSLIPGVILAAVVLKTTSAHKAPECHPIYAYVGFAMSIVWIYMLATEIIGLLKTVGIMFSMTDTAIGLGILAWGNSLGDIVANISLAEAGYPRMALGASIGAPLLNLLLGFGLSFTISLKPGESAVIEYSPTITLLCSTLAFMLLAVMFSTLSPPEKSKKLFGYLLIASYGVYFALAVCLEYKFINF